MVSLQCACARESWDGLTDQTSSHSAGTEKASHRYECACACSKLTSERTLWHRFHTEMAFRHYEFADAKLGDSIVRTSWGTGGTCRASRPCERACEWSGDLTGWRICDSVNTRRASLRCEFWGVSWETWKMNTPLNTEDTSADRFLDGCEGVMQVYLDRKTVHGIVDIAVYAAGR